MDNIKKITEGQKKQLEAPLPKEAISQHPTKKFLSVIKPIYVTERLNQVFGMGGWHTISEVLSTSEGKDAKGKPVRTANILTKLYLPEYDLCFESFGGSDNSDLGDAMKGAVSDGISKIAAVHLHVGIDVYKGKGIKHTPVKRMSTGVDKQNPNLCLTCGSPTVFKEGVSKAGKEYKAYFCESKDPSHTVWA